MSADDHEDVTTRVTRKGQVTIPRELREEYDLEAGDELHWEMGEDGIVVRKVPGDAGRGMLVDEDVSDAKREEMATEMAAAIREKRRRFW